MGPRDYKRDIGAAAFAREEGIGTRRRGGNLSHEGEGGDQS